MFFTEVSVVWALLIVASAVFALYLSAYSLFRRQVSGAVEFSLFMFTVAMYSLGYAFEMNAHTLERIIDFLRFQFIWTSFTAPVFLLFVLRFILQDKIPGPVYLLLFLIPMIIAVMGLTIDSHRLIYRSYSLVQGEYFPVIKYEGGPWYVIQQIYLIGTSIIAEVLLLIHIFRVRGKIQKQSILILIASVMPTVNAMIQPGRTVHSNLDLQPFVMVLMGILLSIALFRFQMLDLVRAARWMAVDSIHDYLVILDREGIVQDINHAGRNSRLLEDLRIGSHFYGNCDFSRFVEEGSFLDYAGEHKNVQRFDWKEKSYKFTVSKVFDWKGDITGYALLINENTELVKLLDELERQAIVDELTSMFNRRQLINLADREIEIARRDESSMGIIILDLDHFKHINDSYGHLTGDKVLRAVSACIRERLRPSEISGRYGGEEFCIICPHSNGTETLAIAERLRTAIEKLRIDIDLGGKTIGVTASFGVYATGDLHNSGTEDLLKNADLALYHAKENGRNQSVLWTAQVTAPSPDTPLIK